MLSIREYFSAIQAHPSFTLCCAIKISFAFSKVLSLLKLQFPRTQNSAADIVFKVVFEVVFKVVFKEELN